MSRHLRLKLWTTVTLVAFAGGADAAWANHRDGHPGTSAAVSQYVEHIPTSSGPQATGIGKERFKPLPRRAKAKLVQQGGEDAALLEKIATSSAYGAPQGTLGKGKKGGKDKDDPGAGGAAVVTRDDPRDLGDASTSEALSAAVSVVTDGSDKRLLGLLVVMLLITAAALASAGYRQRALREPTRR